MKRKLWLFILAALLVCCTSSVILSCSDFLSDAVRLVPEEPDDPYYPGDPENPGEQPWFNGNGLSVSPASRVLLPGATVQLTATTEIYNQTNSTMDTVAVTAVTWSSSNKAVATVSESGLVTAMSAGSATISAATTNPVYTANCSITVSTDIPPEREMALVTAGMFNNGLSDMTVGSFYIDPLEVTQGRYSEVMGKNPVNVSTTCGYGDDYPVYNVTWYDAVAYCNALSEFHGYETAYTVNGTTVTLDITRNGYRLPTEAEWEFAARGGNSTHGYEYSGSDTIGDVAWYLNNAGNTTHTVGSKAANELGLHDMSGNVWEWCHDWYGGYPDTDRTDYIGPSTGTDRVVRGGDWNTSYECNVTSRYYLFPEYVSYSSLCVGFRVVRSAGTEVSVTGVTLSPSSTIVVTGETAQLTSTTVPFDAGNPALAWASSNTSVATVSSTGLVTGVSEGRTTITVTTVDGGFTASCSLGVWDQSESIDMVRVDGGTYDNEPEHMSVSDFLIGTYEITQKQYNDVMGSMPDGFYSGYGSGDNYPVSRMTWYEAAAFCNALSAHDGFDNVYTISGTTVTADFTKNGYRLPTEDEWEFAARGGNSTHGYSYSGSDTIDDVAWYYANSESSAHQVGTKAANELGIFDMSGNVQEWCHDWYGDYPPNVRTDYIGPSTGTSRTVRGGGWSSSGYDVSARMMVNPSSNGYDLGFRVMRRP